MYVRNAAGRYPMQTIYRGWFISQKDEDYMAVKGKEKIIGPIEKIRREIDMRAFEEMREEEQ